MVEEEDMVDGKDMVEGQETVEVESRGEDTNNNDSPEGGPPLWKS